MDHTPQQHAKLLFSGSIGFYITAHSLYQMTDEIHFSAFVVNLAYAAELSVKAFVLENSPNADEKMLRQIGHDLNAGLQSAIRVGYAPPNEVTKDLFNILNDHHIHHSARYLSGPPINMKPFALMLTAMAHHLTTIGEKMSMPVRLPTPPRISAP